MSEQIAVPNRFAYVAFMIVDYRAGYRELPRRVAPSLRSHSQANKLRFALNIELGLAHVSAPPCFTQNPNSGIALKNVVSQSLPKQSASLRPKRFKYMSTISRNRRLAKFGICGLGFGVTSMKLHCTRGQTASTRHWHLHLFPRGGALIHTCAASLHAAKFFQFLGPSRSLPSQRGVARWLF